MKASNNFSKLCNVRPYIFSHKEYLSIDIIMRGLNVNAG
mgnify:CR=1 FL=1